MSGPVFGTPAFRLGLSDTVFKQLTSPAFRLGLSDTVRLLASPSWEQTVFRALHQLEQLEVSDFDEDTATSWINLPVHVRALVVSSIVWTCVFVQLVALSLEHSREAAIVRDSTGANPLELAGLAALLAGAVYRHFARPDRS